MTVGQTDPRARGFAEILTDRAEHVPETVAFIYLHDGETSEETITYLALYERALAIAEALREESAPGARVLLLLPPGPDYVTSVFACLCARRIVVSAVPPHPKRLHRTLPRLLAIARDAEVDSVLTTAAIKDAAQGMLSGAPELSEATWIAADACNARPRDGWELESAGADDVAFLQYTSGSTAEPRGVMLTHGNLLDNSDFISRAFGHSVESRGFIWLPPYHDMGLIGGILQPVHAGTSCVLTSPLAIMKRPARWLQGISRHRATTSGGPNFAYDLCVQKVAASELEGLDLSCWEVAFNGAEPVRAQTIRSFSEWLAPAGFRPNVFFPCYGLAEATLMVTASRKDEQPVVTDFDATGLGDGVARPPAADSSPPVELVGCGAPNADHEVVIVDPDSRRACEPGRIGEIWVAGPSVAAGYWRRERETDECFNASLDADDGRRFLRTGDLGVFRDGELFVVGRLKDLIILRGRNHHPHDLERLAEESHPMLRPYCSAAFFDEGEEGVVLVMEANPADDADVRAAIDAVRRQLARELDIRTHRIVVCGRGNVPKTTSGKVQRKLCSSLLADGELDVLGEWRLRATG